MFSSNLNKCTIIIVFSGLLLYLNQYAATLYWFTPDKIHKSFRKCNIYTGGLINNHLIREVYAMKSKEHITFRFICNKRKLVNFYIKVHIRMPPPPPPEGSRYMSMRYSNSLHTTRKWEVNMGATAHKKTTITYSEVWWSRRPLIWGFSVVICTRTSSYCYSMKSFHQSPTERKRRF